MAFRSAISGRYEPLHSAFGFLCQMSAVHGISQSRIFLGGDNLLDFEGHVWHRFHDKLQSCQILFKTGLGNARGMVDVVRKACATNHLPVMATEGIEELLTGQTH